MYSQGVDHLSTQHISSRNVKPTKTGSSRGLTVQEIKAMTAMRLAQDQESAKIPPDHLNQQAYLNQQQNLQQKGTIQNVRKQQQASYMDQQQQQELLNYKSVDLKSQPYRQHEQQYGREVHITPPTPIIPASKSLSIQELKELTKLRLKAGGNSLNNSAHDINIHNELHYDSDSVVSSNYGGLVIPHVSRSNNTSPEVNNKMYKSQIDNNSSFLSTGQYIKKQESLSHSHHSQPQQLPQRTLSRPQSYSSSKQMNTFAALGSSPPDQSFNNMLNHHSSSLNSSTHSSSHKNARPIDEIIHRQQQHALFSNNNSINNSSHDYIGNGDGSIKYLQAPPSSTLSNSGHSMNLYSSSNNIMSSKNSNFNNISFSSSNNGMDSNIMNSLSIDSYDFMDGINQSSSSSSSSSASKFEESSMRLNRQYANLDPWKTSHCDYTLYLNDLNDSNHQKQQQQQQQSNHNAAQTNVTSYNGQSKASGGVTGSGNGSSGFDHNKDFYTGSTISNNTNSTTTSNSIALSISPQFHYNMSSGIEEDHKNSISNPREFVPFSVQNTSSMSSNTQSQNNYINSIDTHIAGINTNDDYTDGMLLKPPGFDSYMVAKSRYQQQQQQKQQEMMLLSSHYNDGKMRLDTETMMNHNGGSLDMLARDSDDSDLPSLSTHRSGTEDSLSPLLLLTHTPRSRTASYCDLSSSSPKSPKTMRNRTKLPIQCPGMLRSRSMSDSTNLPFEMIESILMSAANSPMPYPRSAVVQGMTRFSRASSSEDAAGLDTSAHIYENTYNNTIFLQTQAALGQTMKKNQQKSTLFQSETADWNWNEKNEIDENQF